MEEAIPGVPGAYPGTPADESGPTPSPAPRHHHTFQHHQRHEHHEHNKLHKANDPRGHRHTDSGVGMIESQPAHPSSVDETKPRAFSENTPAQNAFTYEPKHSSSPQEPNYTYAAPYERPVEPMQEPDHAQESLKAPKEADGKTDGKTDSKTDSKTHDNTTTSSYTNPPYWGNLPKAIRGGIYNTVTGHGSAGDDHAQHHGMPQRSAPDRGHITGPTTEIHSGGVYNTVAGHGSQDEESRRHAATHLVTDVPDSQPGADIALAAPLPKIAEEKEKDKTSDHIATKTGRSDIARGFLPETAVRDDVALAEAAGVTSSARQESPRPSGARGSRNESLNSGADFAATHREFPLSSSPDRAHRRSQDVSVPEERQQDAESQGSRDAMAMAAGAGAVGAAVAASERKDKPNKLRKQEPSPSPKSKQRSKDVAIDKTEKIVTTSSPPRHSHDKGVTRSERISSEEASSASEKKHHGILGIFHRRKDSKGEKDAKRSDKDVAEPKPNEQSHHSSHKKEEAAAAAAAGAGTYGLFHHHKDDEQKSKDQRSNSVPTARRSEETKRHSRRMSANQSAAAAVAESAGAFGVLYQKPQEKDINERRDRKSIDTSKPPAPPERSPKRRSLTPPSSTVFAAETTHAPSTTQGSHGYPAVQSHNDSAKYATAGVAAGLGASIFTNKDLQSQPEESNPSALTQPQTGATLYSFENPREPPLTPATALTAKTGQQSQVSSVRSPKSSSPRNSQAVTNEPGHYNTLPSGTASGVRSSVGYGSDKTDTRGSDAYNHLPSGTASGVKSDASSDRDAYSAPRREERNADDESGLYNVLPSGTPSGVKIKSKEASRSSMTEPASQAISKHGDDQYNTLPSGTASGVHVEHQHRTPVEAETEPQAAKHSLVAAPMPLRHKEKREDLAAFPSPEQAHEMSPEVLPDSYREQSHAVPSTGRDPAPTRSHASAVDPALAAATGAWAGKTATGSVGASDHSRVMHKCEHCGRDNDISSQFTKENMAKMSKKHGSTGNWWQEAWSRA